METKSLEKSLECVTNEGRNYGILIGDSEFYCRLYSGLSCEYQDRGRIVIMDFDRGTQELPLCTLLTSDLFRDYKNQEL